MSTDTNRSFPFTTWYRLRQDDGSLGYHHKTEVWGETSRSWLCGTYRFDPVKLPKKHTEFLNDEQVAEMNWRDRHVWKIRDYITNRIEPTALRKIAEAVGYKEMESSR